MFPDGGKRGSINIRMGIVSSQDQPEEPILKCLSGSKRLLQAGEVLPFPIATKALAQSLLLNLNCTSPGLDGGEGLTCVVPCFPPSGNIGHIHNPQFPFNQYIPYNTSVRGYSIMPRNPLQSCGHQFLPLRGQAHRSQISGRGCHICPCA